MQAHVRRHAQQRGRDRARQPRQGTADAEDDEEQPLHIDPETGRHRVIVHARADHCADLRPAENKGQCAKDCQSQCDDEKPVGGVIDAQKRHTPRKDRRHLKSQCQIAPDNSSNV